MPPILILFLATALVLVCILKLRMGAFFGLILAAFLVSFLAPGDGGDPVGRVVTALGETAGKIGVIIACAAVIGQCMMLSGAAGRIVHSLLGWFGEKRAPAALMASGFVLSVPVFFDTVFYLLVPLARTLHRQTRRDYLLYILAIAGGAAITHTLVPPTPGPLAMAQNLSVDVGIMILMGLAVGLPSAWLGLFVARRLQSRLSIPMRPIGGADTEPEASTESEDGPGLWAALLPVVLPVVLISARTLSEVLLPGGAAEGGPGGVSAWILVLGNPNIALLLSAAAAIGVYVHQRRPRVEVLGKGIEGALMGAGLIILITAAGGAFGAMLKMAGVGTAILEGFGGGETARGVGLLAVGWLIASLLKVSQGSGTVAMITGSGIVGAMVDPGQLPFHPVYLALAIGFGSLCGSWMNDSGFWIVARMSGLTEVEALKTWTVLLGAIGLFGLLLTLALALLFPMPLAVVPPG